MYNFTHINVKSLINHINNNDNQNISEKTESKYIKDKCSYCNSYEFIFNDIISQNICCNCGSIFEKIKYKSEKYNAKFTPSSINDLLVPQLNNDFQIKGLNNQYLKNIHKWNSISYKDRSLQNVLRCIDKACNILKLKICVSDEAKILYKHVIVQCYYNKKLITKQNIPRGRNKLGIIAACVYYACKKSGYIRIIKNIAKAFNITTSCVNNGCKIFIRYLKQTDIDFNILISKPSDFVKCLSIEFNLKSEDIDKFRNILIKIEQNHLITEHTPYTIALAALVFYYNKKNIKGLVKDVAKSFNVSPSTILKVYNTIVNYKTFLNGYNSIISPEETPECTIKPKELTKININERLQQLNNIDVNKYDILNNTDIFDLTVPNDKTIFNSTLIKAMRFF